MKKSTILFSILAVAFAFFAFETTKKLDYQRDEVTPIPESPQRTGGDADAGWDYLRYGNYIGAGVPFKIFKRTLRKKTIPNRLNREGNAGKVPYVFNVFEEEGVELVGGLNCFGCHSSMLDSQYIAGLGDHSSDFADNDNGKFFTNFLKFVRFRYGKNSVQYKNFLPLARGSKYVSPYVTTPFLGVNPAFKLEEAAVAHRHPSDLTWADGEQVFPLTKEIYGSDVPPLWNVKKKNALYYNGMGRGDFTKLLMQVMVVAIKDSTKAREINENFDDVLAWLYSLEAPKYPKEIDLNKATLGKAIFEDACSKCHGTYGEEEDYPNLLVGLDVVKTDSVYAVYSYNNKNFTNWLNDSWIMTTEPKAWVQPELGYVAPPLDGVWATAPYLHNGSIPNLETLLNSKKRPTKWKRSFISTDFDYEKVGWKYQEVAAAEDKKTYDTTLKGYGNGGHYFGDDLKDEHRTALIEYLKTL